MIELKNIYKIYSDGDSEIRALDGISLHVSQGEFGVKQSERTEMAKKALERVGLGDRGHKYPAQLSGGQQQRVSIARALAGNPPVILADEPTGALDSKTGREVLEFLKVLNNEGTTIVLITHDNSIADEIKRVVRIQDGKIVSDEVKGDAQ